MKNIEKKVESFINELPYEFSRKMVITGLIRNADWQIEKNREIHKTNHDKGFDLINSGNFDEDRDGAKLERFANNMNELNDQHKELTAYRAQLVKAYDAIVGTPYVEATPATTTRNVSALKKQFA